MENKINKTYLIIGTNLGNRLENLAIAKNLIEKNIGSIVKASSIYETEPWGVARQSNYYNQVIYVYTPLSAATLLAQIHSIEKSMGRVRTKKYEARIIDIDILFFNHEQYSTDELIIPHSRIPERKFVLIPLKEIAASFIHPVLQQSVSTLLQQSNDPLQVNKVHV